MIVLGVGRHLPERMSHQGLWFQLGSQSCAAYPKAMMWYIPASALHVVNQNSSLMSLPYCDMLSATRTNGVSTTPAIAQAAEVSGVFFTTLGRLHKSGPLI
jgi:hypothetical protein